MIMDFLKPHADPVGDDRYAKARHRMVEEIKEMANETYDLEALPVSGKVLSVMERVPRHRFVPEAEHFAAYGNHPLPIGHGQTISQPYIVALMTELLAPDKQGRVLEVGTGSGYQTAILAEMAGEVFSLEIIDPLAARAAGLLNELGYTNVRMKAGNGNDGWPEQVPSDGIIVTAAAAMCGDGSLQQKIFFRCVPPTGGQITNEGME